ncbi:hypothetical protein IWW36_004683 [Coemansia brasiliensis]|uniref:Ubiquilin n=1 Tax=Coemansia brasiliensis TaxID=2650707 RepID=A0A9W8LW17_9FUNG|nr:hypothetical protein IWW36_004683 [Coemansia brasiliensis]
MENEESTITLLVRQTNGSVTEHQVSSLRITVGELKESLSQTTEIPKERIRLMFESQILKDSQTIEHYGIGNNSILRLVRLAGGQDTHPRNMFMPNPELAQTIMMANPQMREVMENNPELRQMMSNPEIMQQSINAAQNPRLMQEVQRNNDRVLSNLESAPGGYAHIRRMYNNIQKPLARVADNSFRFSLDELNRRRAKSMGVTRPDASKVNTTPLANPWARRTSRSNGRPGFDSRNPLAMVDQVSRNADRLARLNISAGQSASSQSSLSPTDDPLSLVQLQRQLSGLSPLAPATHQPLEDSGNTAAATTRSTQYPSSPREMSAMSVVNPAFERSSHDPSTQPSATLTESKRSQYLEQYHEELERLEEMGFEDREKNLRALIECNGNLSEALTLIAGEEE